MTSFSCGPIVFFYNGVIPKFQTTKQLEERVRLQIKEKIQSLSGDSLNNPKITPELEKAVENHAANLKKLKSGPVTYDFKNGSCRILANGKDLSYNIKLPSYLFKSLKLTSLEGITYVEKCEDMYPKSEKSETAETKSEKAEKAIKLIDRFIDNSADLKFSQTDNALSVEDERFKLSLSTDTDFQDQYSKTVHLNELKADESKSFLYKKIKRIMGASSYATSWGNNLEIKEGPKIKEGPNKEIYLIKDKKSDLVFTLEVKKEGGLTSQSPPQIKEQSTQTSLKQAFGEDSKNSGGGSGGVFGSWFGFLSPQEIVSAREQSKVQVDVDATLGHTDPVASNLTPLSPPQTPSHHPSVSDSGRKAGAADPQLEISSQSPRSLPPSSPVTSNGPGFVQSNMGSGGSNTSAERKSDEDQSGLGLVAALGSWVGLGSSDKEIIGADDLWTRFVQSWGKVNESVSGGDPNETLPNAHELFFRDSKKEVGSGDNPDELGSRRSQSSSNQMISDARGDHSGQPSDPLSLYVV